jgi:hypothetical protein
VEAENMLLRVDMAYYSRLFSTFKWVPIAAFISFSSSLLAAIAIRSAAGDVSAYAREAPVGVIDFIGILVVAPIIETLMLSLLAMSLSKVLRSKVYACVLSAFLIAIFHGIFSWIQSLLVFLPFVVFSTPFWGGNFFSRKPVILSASIHIFYNLLVCCVALSGFI